jgi:RNA polymerase-binding transcription factor DksA
MHETDFERHAEQLGRLVTLGLGWARVLQEDKGNAELTFVYWFRAVRLAAKVEGLTVSEATMKWVWDTIRTAPRPESVFIVPTQSHVDPVTPTPQPDIADDGKISSSPSDGLSEFSRSCFEALRRWRLEKARKLGKPPYVIAHDTLLIELAKHRPTTTMELFALQRIGLGFSERYGDEIVQLLTDWCCENMDDFERPVANPVNDSPVAEAQAKRTPEDHEPLDDEPGVELDANSSISVVICQHCGIRIPPERIEVFPDAKYCVKCQEGFEQNGDFVNVASPICPRCERKGIHSELVYRRARDPEIKGYFLGCSRYPHCQYVER